MNHKSTSANQIIQQLTALGNEDHVKAAEWFFKTAPGEYGHGDKFIGLRMPTIRQQIKNFKPLSLETCIELLHSKFHEIRLFALLMMVELFKPKKSQLKDAVFDAYMAHREYINNWDLVDCSCYKIVGPYLELKDRGILYQLAESDSLWDRRIAMVSTYHFIRLQQYKDTIKLATILKYDSEDLMHKAVGWMLKEVGKRDEQLLSQFLNEHYSDLPRTLLRTAIEKLPEPIRQDYLKGRI